MKTAVDWLVDHLYLVIPNEERDFLEGMRKEALVKEKEQIEDACNHGIKYGYTTKGEQYYNQTYNQEETLEEWKSKFIHHCAIKTNKNK
jgi:hypothetical protein